MTVQFSLSQGGERESLWSTDQRTITKPAAAPFVSISLRDLVSFVYQLQLSAALLATI